MWRADAEHHVDGRPDLSCALTRPPPPPLPSLLFSSPLSHHLARVTESKAPCTGQEPCTDFDLVVALDRTGLNALLHSTSLLLLGVLQKQAP